MVRLDRRRIGAPMTGVVVGPFDPESGCNWVDSGVKEVAPAIGLLDSALDSTGFDLGQF